MNKINPEKKKRLKTVLIWGVIICFLLFFGVRTFILVAGSIDYVKTKVYCIDTVIPSRRQYPESQLPSTMLVYEVKPFIVITDRGNMYPGDEYESYGEGAWYGMATLLFSGKKGAHFVINYPTNDPGIGYSRHNCRGYLPRGVYD